MRPAILLAILVLLTLACQEGRLTGEQVSATLDAMERKLDWLGYRLAQETWEQYTFGDSDSLAFFAQLCDHVMADPATRGTLWEGRRVITDNEAGRRLEMIHSRMLDCAVEAAPAVKHLVDSLTGRAVGCRAAFFGAGISRFDGAAWRSDRSGVISADGMARLIRLRHQQARKAGYSSYLALRSQGELFDDYQWQQLLNQIDSLTAPAYRQLLQQGRQHPAIEAPLDRLLDRFLAQQAEIDRFFDADRQFEIVTAGLRGLGFDLNKQPIYRSVDTATTSTADAAVLVVRSPHDQRLATTGAAGLDCTRRFLAAAGQALHAASITEPLPLYARCQSGIWQEGIRRFFASLAIDSVWLTRYGGLSSSRAGQVHRAQRELSLLDLRLLLVEAAFELEAYRNPTRDLDGLYRDLYARFTFASDSTASRPWTPLAVSAARPMHYRDLLAGYLLATQTWNYLRKTNGSVVGNPETAAFLTHNYFRFGSRYDWTDLLRRGTGEGLNPSHLLSWLQS
jgi:hypothetical protein